MHFYWITVYIYMRKNLILLYFKHPKIISFCLCNYTQWSWRTQMMRHLDICTNMGHLLENMLTWTFFDDYQVMSLNSYSLLWQQQHYLKKRLKLQISSYHLLFVLFIRLTATRIISFWLHNLPKVCSSNKSQPIINATNSPTTT